MHTVLKRWKNVCEAIANAQAQRHGKQSPIILIAVAKTQPPEAILPLLEAGHCDFGENRVQEAMRKWPGLKAAYPQARLHLIGSLQANKAQEALSLFDVIHTVDRPSLVDALIKARGEGRGARGKEFFVQVNTGDEPQKGGVIPNEFFRLMDYILAFRPSPLAPLPISGLMCIPPAGDPPAPHFALLRTMAEKSRLAHLSMGMSGDYEMAIRFGATHIRVGTAIFGERQE